MITINSKTFVVGSIATDSFVAVNKKVLRSFNGDATLAVVLCELISIYKYQLANHKVDALDAFPLPISFLEKTCCLTAYKQQHALARLQADNLLTTAILGMPSSRWITLNFDAIAKMLEDAEAVSLAADAEKHDFYEKITEAASSGETQALEESLDNIKAPLRGCIILATQRVYEPGKKIVWTSEAVGVFKLALRKLQKQELFDYGRFIDLLEICKETSGDMSKLAYEAMQKWKLIPERAPIERLYDYTKGI